MAEVANISISALLGQPSTANISVGNFVAPSSWTADFGLKTGVSLPASTSNIDINLATLFPGLTTCMGVFVQEVTPSPLGFSVSTNSTGTRAVIKPAGFFAFSPDNQTPQHLYFDNATGAIIQIQIGVFGS